MTSLEIKRSMAKIASNDSKIKEIALSKAIDINTERSYNLTALSSSSTGAPKKMNIETMLKDAETIYNWLKK